MLLPPGTLPRPRAAPRPFWRAPLLTLTPACWRCRQLFLLELAIGQIFRKGPFHCTSLGSCSNTPRGAALRVAAIPRNGTLTCVGSREGGAAHPPASRAAPGLIEVDSRLRGVGWAALITSVLVAVYYNMARALPRPPQYKRVLEYLSRYGIR